MGHRSYYVCGENRTVAQSRESEKLPNLRCGWHYIKYPSYALHNMQVHITTPLYSRSLAMAVADVPKEGIDILLGNDVLRKETNMSNFQLIKARCSW